MTYQTVTFSAGETLTSTKMNQMAANDEALRDGSGLEDGAITADKIDFTTVSDLVDYKTNTITTSNITVGGFVNGSELVFSGLDPDQTYLVDYAANLTIGRVNQDGTTSYNVKYSKDGGTTWGDIPNSGVGDITIRTAGSGADGVVAGANALACFTGTDSIRVKIFCTSANTLMSYHAGSALAKLYKVPNSFTKNTS